MLGDPRTVQSDGDQTRTRPPAPARSSTASTASSRSCGWSLHDRPALVRAGDYLRGGALVPRRRIERALRRQSSRELRGAARARAVVHAPGNGVHVVAGLHRRQTGSRDRGRGLKAVTAVAGLGRTAPRHGRLWESSWLLAIVDLPSEAPSVRNSTDAPDGVIWPEAAPRPSRRTAPSAAPTHRR